MTLNDLVQRITELEQVLQEESRKVVVATAISGLSIVKDRSINKGIFKDGVEGNYAEYSTRKISTYFFKGRERNKKGTDYIKNNKKGNWHGFRKAQGLNSEKVNLSYSNRFWANTKISGNYLKDHNLAICEIRNNDADVAKYSENLKIMYGNFLIPTKSEQNTLRLDAKRELASRIRKILFK